jgi:hypothetical protein
VGLNGDPGELAELPGVTGLSGPQTLFGAPGCPVVGDTIASAVTGAAKATAIAKGKEIPISFRIIFLQCWGGVQNQAP